MPLPLFDSILRATIQPCLVLIAVPVEDGGPLEEDEEMEAPALRVDTTAPAVASLCEACLLPPTGYTQ